MQRYEKYLSFIILSRGFEELEEYLQIRKQFFGSAYRLYNTYIKCLSLQSF